MTSYVAEVGRSAAALGSAASTYNVPFTGAVPIGDTLVMAVNTTIGGAGGQTGLSATDTKGNTWTQRAIQDVYSTGNKSANGNIAVLTCTVSSALTTSDSVTITSAGGALTRWAVIIKQFTTIAGFDTASGGQTTTASITSGTTAAAAQQSQAIIGVAGWTDAAGTTSITPTAPTGASTGSKLSTYPLNTTSPRALQMWWTDVNASGTRTATATLNTPQPNGGIVIALNLVNQAPTAAFSHVEDNLTTNVDGTGSSDVDGSIASYDWNWGDASSHGSGSTASHAYAAAGTYTVTLTVTDNQGATGTVAHGVTVTSALVAGNPGDTLTTSMNRLAKTVGLTDVAAANVWAGTTGMELVAALNVKAGNTLPNYRELAGVLNQLAGTTGLGVDGAAAAIKG